MFSGATNTQVPSFEEYAVASWATLYRSAYLLAGNHADAEDLAQQTLIKVHSAWSKVSASDSMNAYVRRILTNTFLSSRRPLRRRRELLTDEIADWSGAATTAGTSDERLTLWPHVKQLPPQQRAVIVLRYFEDLSEGEIAEALGCSRGTVKSTAHRALRSLKAALGADGETRPEYDGEEG